MRVPGHVILLGRLRRRRAIGNLKLLLTYLRRYRARLAIGLTSMLLATVFSRLIPWLLKLAIDGLKAGEPLGHIVQIAAGMVVAAAFGALFLYLQRWLLISTSRRVEYDVRRDLFAHMQRQDLSFFGGRKTGDLMAHFTNDLSAVRDVAGPGIMYAATMTTMLVTSIALMLAINPILTLVAFAPYPIITVVTFFFGRAMYRRSRRVQDLFGDLSARVQEDLGGIRVTRAYVQEENSARNFETLSRAYLQANMDVARLRGVFFAAMNALAGTGLVLALLVGGRQVMAGTITLGGLVAFSAYLAELTWPVIAVGWVIGMLQRGASAVGRINRVLESQPAIISGQLHDRPLPRVRFDHVTFRYPGADEDALRDITFALSPGETLGIVGRTGSGKSTILKLLLRFYDPTDGRILLDDADLRERDLDQVRAIVGYTPQDGFLFSRTIAKNIAYGVTHADEKSIRRAAERVRLHDEITGFANAYESLVGERGITLSGGQRQRASLARALITEPELLLLDDTLSSVDAEKETEILDELRDFMVQRTCIVVSHRISAVRHADLILVLEDGKLTESGRHEELLENGGLYARLHERQRLAAEIEGTA